MFYIGLIIILLFVIVKGMGSSAKQRAKHNEDMLRGLGNLWPPPAHVPNAAIGFNAENVFGKSP